METYEQRQSRIKEEMVNDWIGLPIDMRKKKRKEVLAHVRECFGDPVKEPAITTDMKGTEGVPGFIRELERDVYDPGETKMITL